jgi:hypothetical protein
VAAFFIGWALRSHATAAVAAIMVVCALLSLIIGRRRLRRFGKTTLVRHTLIRLWAAFAISISLVGFVALPAGLISATGFHIVFMALMGAANFTSGALLRWPVQQWLAVGWWAAALAAVFLPWWLVYWLYLLAVVIGEIIFGVYLMIRESHEPAAA